MASRRVEEYAHRYGLSNKQAKRKMGRGARRDDGMPTIRIARGMPVAGTGKPGGAKGR